MALYTGIQSIYDGLLGDYKDKGFSIHETPCPVDWGEFILEIHYHGRNIYVSFYKTKLMHQPIKDAAETIRNACETYLQGVSEHGN